MIALLLFQFGFLLFLLLLWLPWLELPKLCWIKVVRVDILVLFLTLEETVFHLGNGCGLVVYGFYYVELGSLYPYFLENFFFLNHKWVLNFIKSFTLCQLRWWASVVAHMVKNLPAWSGRFPGEGMATYSSILAWRIPWAEEPGRFHVVAKS